MNWWLKENMRLNGGGAAEAVAEATQNILLLAADDKWEELEPLNYKSIYDIFYNHYLFASIYWSFYMK